MDEHVIQIWRDVRDRAGPFPPQAYQFVIEGLAHTSRMIHGDDIAEDTSEAVRRSRHVNGQQLCMGLRDYALRQYGKLAGVVLRRWHIRETDDFGRIVFAMVEAQRMHKTEEDSIEDFRAVFDFDEAFGDLIASS